MYGLRELLLKEEIRLKNIKGIVDERLVDVPDGSLRITSCRKQVHYLLSREDDTNQENHKLANSHNVMVNSISDSTENSTTSQPSGDPALKKLKYIRKDNLQLVQKLAQKSYDQKIKRLVDRRLRQIDRIVRDYEDDEIENIYNKLNSSRKELISAVEMPWEQKVREWKSIPYIGKEFKPNTPEIYTKKGERVRSKSEKIIADTLNDLGIEYKYECPLRLKGVGIVYPDFTILRKRDGRQIYWEHDGRMDEPEYAEKAIRKINSYINNRIFPGDTLIISYESSKVLLDDRVIKSLIEKFVLGNAV